MMQTVFVTNALTSLYITLYKVCKFEKANVVEILESEDYCAKLDQDR